MSRPIITAIDEETGIARITLNRPEVLNALDVAMARAFRAAVEDICARQGVRAIILAAAGRAFVAGGDVAAFGGDLSKSADVVNALLDALHPAILALRAQDAPVIAAVRGVAAGAGLSLVLGADLVVAEEDSRFLIAYNRIGVSPDCGGTWFLPRKVGPAKAAEMMLLDLSLDAAEARIAGIVNRVVPAGKADDAAAEMAAQIASGPTRAFGHSRRLFSTAFDRGLSEQLEEERAAFIAGTATPDFVEGVSAFLEKRRPTFRSAD